MSGSLCVCCYLVYCGAVKAFEARCFRVSHDGWLKDVFECSKEFQNVLWVFKECFDDVSWVFQGRFMVDSRGFRVIKGGPK